jgi:intracellular multiplication protein IcmP
MAGAPQQGGGQSDNSTGILWGIAALFGFVGGIWYVFKVQIIRGYLSLKLMEINLLNSLSGNHYAELSNTISAALQSPAQLALNDVAFLGASVGSLIRYPFVLLMLILAVVVYFSNTRRVFRNTYSMKMLAELEYTNWPQISPVIGLDLLSEKLDVGPWAMAMTPMQFCKRYRLLEEVRPQRVEGMRRADWDRIDVVLKRGEANRLFIMQLENLWQGPDKLPPYARALFAAFAARVNADPDGSKLIMQMARTCRTKMDYSGTDELLKKHYQTKTIQKIVQSHAYVLTVMASMLESARDDGVQASSDFLWLKPINRRLWYTLNTVGRQTPYIEVGGVFAHWVAEKEAGRRLIVPMVEEATNAVELALKDIVYRRDEE